MSKWLAGAVAVVAFTTGCNYGASAFTCTDNASCTGGADGVCETSGFCSFADSSCTNSGRRYGDLAGGMSNKCTDEPMGSNMGSNMPDAFVPPVDALVCYGSGIVKVCFNDAPKDALMLADAKTLNTDSDALCVTPTSGGDGYCVVAATNITVGARLRATGKKPLVLVASGAITTTAQIDVGSMRVAPEVGYPITGAGTQPSDCKAGTPPTNAGGGGGGSFVGKGGTGGAGTQQNDGAPADAVAVAAIAALRGGCAGQAGNNTANSGGVGGGAIYLIAATKIQLDGGINAGGAGASGGKQRSLGVGGGGGGGAGGMIVLDAPDVVVNDALIASGGGGGEGGSESFQANQPGDFGDDAVTDGAAAGGTGNAQNGGDGGNGSSKAAAAPGDPGKNSNGNSNAGGGGGGGGAGYIKIYGDATPTLSTKITPPATL